MHNFQANYDKILEVLKGNIEKPNLINQKRKPRLTGIEMVVMDLAAE